MPSARTALSLLLVALSLAPSAARADDWGLTREPSGKPKRATPGARPKLKPGATPDAKPGVASTSAPALDAQSVQRARYRQLLLADVEQPALRERLFALYRERDGQLDGLAAELAALPDPGMHGLCLLGYVERARGQLEAARLAFERAATAAPRALAPLLALAELAAEASSPAEAVRRFEQALALSPGKLARGDILRRLGEQALAAGDFDGAEQRYEALAALSPGSSYARTEHARALTQRGEHARAAQVYERVARALADDPRVLPPLWLEQARSELQARQPARALPLLERVRSAKAAEEGVRADADALLVEAHRAQGTLPELAKQLTSAASASPSRLRLLARIHDELGDQAKALEVYRRALSRSPRELELRERVVELLTSRGDLHSALEEQRALVRQAPREPRYLIGLAKTLLETGARDDALALLDATAKRFANDARIQRALLDVFGRWQEPERAQRVLATLRRIEPNDPVHVIALGEQRLEQGDEAGALQIFRRILELGLPPAEAHVQLADTLLDHDMAERALAEYEAAVRLRPDALSALRGLAETLERLARPGPAAERWQEVLALTTDGTLRREARRRIVRLWSSAGELSRKRAELERAFWHPQRQSAPDLEAGRFLAESHRMLATGGRRPVGDSAQLAAAERVLSRLVELAPGDVESLLALERLHVQRGQLVTAIAVLERLVQADPQHARGYLSRMAEHALATYRDEDAIAYAERALALDPNDARAHERVGDLYRARQSSARAIAAYERALALDPDAHAVGLRLAELYVAAGELERAEQTLLRVLRGSPDDDLVRQAARELLPIAQRTGSLRGVEQALLSLGLGHPQRPVFRAMLIELYGALVRPLAEATADPAVRAELTELAQRAVKPLLEALSDVDPLQRRAAVELLGMLSSPHAALPLLHVAEQEGETVLRRAALLAAAAHADASLAPRLLALASAQERRLREVAAWGLARMDDRAALPHLRALASSPTEGVRAQALLGLGRAHDAGSLPLLRAALQGDRDELVRGAAALALALAQDRGSLSQLASTLRSERGQVAIAAALALGGLRDAAGAESLCAALFGVEPELRRAALWALRAIASSAAPAAPPLPPPLERAGLWPLASSWLEREPAASARDALLHHDAALVQAALEALEGPRPRLQAALRVLSGEAPLPGLEPGELRAALLPRLEARLSALRAHPSGEVRAAVLSLLAGLAQAFSSSSASASAELGAGLLDGDERVQAAALDALAAGAALGSADSGASIASVERLRTLARHDDRWWLRKQALGALGSVLGPEAAPLLVEALRVDSFAYVREQAAASLGEHGGAGAEAALAAAASQDPEPRVRAAAERALARLRRR